MDKNRRDFTLAGAAFVLTVALPAIAAPMKARPMYGLIGQMLCIAGKRDALIAILTRASAAMPGCLSYIIAADLARDDAIWITEVWDSKESHMASLKLPAVQAAIAEGRPMIAGFGSRFETAPVGGTGLPTAA
jgi:quinol monooxygenase YgiN